MIISPLKTRQIAKKAFDLAKKGAYAELQEIIDYDFNLEDCDEQGNCILHYAVQGGCLEIVQYLVEKGGLSPTFANHNMVTPYDLASQLKYQKIERYFEEVCGFRLHEAYRNPIRTGLYPDPSIVRVGEDYYMVNSTFVFFPCIPISHSKDLVHWEVIGHAVTDETWAKEYLGPLEGGRGFWAPDISYHNGRFYICATLRMNDDAPCIQTQMVTSSPTPQGPYEKPTIHNIRGIDPSIFTDDDGKCYMLLNRGARIMEISEDGKSILSKPQLIWYGSNKHAPEGPHLLKKDGWYYCFLAEGGTGKGHQISVARSRNLYGPYEECPYNPIMKQQDEGAPIQCCGHGKPVEATDGRWFLVYLCERYLEQEWGMLGRETCLDEIVWTKDGWPLVNGGKGPSYLNKKPLPDVPLEEENGWMAPRVICSDRISIQKERVVIEGDGQDLSHKNCYSLLVKRQRKFDFFVAFQVDMPQENWPRDAGLTLYYDENTFIKFGITSKSVFVAEYVDGSYVRHITHAQSQKYSYRMSIDTKGLIRRFYLDGQLIGELSPVTSICSAGLSKGKRFTGATYGVYVNGKARVSFKELK